MKAPSGKSWLVVGIVLIVVVHVVFGVRRSAANRTAVLVFPAANSRETYFTLHNIRAAQAFGAGAGVKVGILDHSFGTVHHAELYAGGRNFVAGNDEFLTEREWHGYWMATVLHEIAPGAQLFALNTYSFDGPEQRADAMVRAIDWAIENKLDVLSYSAAAFVGEPRRRLDAALQRAHAAGIVTTFLHTAEAGNILPTGLWEDVEDGRAPDVNVLQYDYSVVFIDRYRRAMAGEKTGEPPFLSLSSTAAVTAGVVALMKGVEPRLTPAQCRAILTETSKPMQFDRRKPPRVLDALAAVERAKRAL